MEFIESINASCDKPYKLSINKFVNQTNSVLGFTQWIQEVTWTYDNNKNTI